MSSLTSANTVGGNAPVVATRFGGSSTGRAKLTPLGQEVMRLYQEIGQVALNAASDRIVRLEQLIADGATSAPSEDARLSDTERATERDRVGRLPYSSGSVVNNSG
jgi:molybdenum-dependent DNA-binding transcriptional regulator ModE